MHDEAITSYEAQIHQTRTVRDRCRCVYVRINVCAWKKNEGALNPLTHASPSPKSHQQQQGHDLLRHLGFSEQELPRVGWQIDPFGPSAWTPRFMRLAGTLLAWTRMCLLGREIDELLRQPYLLQQPPTTFTPNIPNITTFTIHNNLNPQSP